MQQCTCGKYKPYNPKGICAPMQPLGSCLNCYGKSFSKYKEKIMANGYWILMWEGWGIGLHMINPYLLEDDQGHNWHIYHGEQPTREEIMERHGLTEDDYFKVIW